MKTKSDIYVERLLREKPTHTRSGIPLTIHNGGRGVRTYSGRSRNGEYSSYGPTDYPQLFGWEHATIISKGKQMNKIKAYFKAFETSLMLMAETRLIYSMKVNNIRAIENLKTTSDSEIIRDALDTAILVKSFGLNDEQLQELLRNCVQKGGKL